jgi:sodium transport system permease protein
MNRILVVAAKELVDTFRDRRTILVTLLTAIAAGPVFLALILNMAANQAEKARELKLPVIGAERAPALVAFFERQQVVILPAPTDYEAKIRSGELDVALVIDANFASDVAAGKAATVRLVYDRSRDRARAAIEAAEAVLRAYNRQWGTQRLVLRGIAPQVALPLEVEAVDLATPQQSGALILFLVAYYGLFAALMGGMAGALDATAGERERGSLEPLLATPASRTALVVGKWGAVFSLGLLIAVLSCLSFLPAQSLLRSESLAALFRFGWVEAAWFIGLLAPLAAALSALMMAIAIRCKTFKEAQANTVVLTLAVTMTPMIGMFSQEGESAWNLWVPALAQSTLMNRVLKNAPIGLLDVAPSLVICIVLTIAALMFVSRQLTKRAAQ